MDNIIAYKRYYEYNFLIKYPTEHYRGNGMTYFAVGYICCKW